MSKSVGKHISFAQIRSRLLRRSQCLWLLGVFFVAPVCLAVSVKPLAGPRDTDKNKGSTVNLAINGKISSQISPWVYGANAVGTFKKIPADLNLTFYRFGGNRFSAYNWENNLSHAGSDYRYQNDLWLCSEYKVDCSKPGAVVEALIERSFAAGAGAVLVTVPILDHVAYKATDGDVCQSKPTKTWECPNRDHLKSLFRRSLPQKKGKLSLKPDPNDATVYQDEFVNWVKQSFAKELKQGKKIFFSMDNEPGLWGSTHNRIRPGGKYCEHNPTYPELLKRNVDYAKAVKSQMNTLVFGPVHYGWLGMDRLQNFAHCSGHGNTPFYEYFLKGLRAERKKAGDQDLIDIYDFHWYSEVRSDGKKGKRITGADTDRDTAKARLQAPRTFWDPNYDEQSWISEDSVNGPIQLLPRVKRWIDTYNAGMGIAITEYTLGAEDHITGGLAQADTLGIFGREGVFAANFWPLASSKGSSAYVKGAFRLFRNYDGRGSHFGPIALSAVSDSISRVSVYASLSGKKDPKVILVVINKAMAKQNVQLTLENIKPIKSSRVFQMYDGQPTPKAAGAIKLGKANRLTVTLPAQSASTIELSL